MSAVATDPVPSVLDVAAQLQVLEETLVALGPELVPERVLKQDLGRVVRSLGRIERAAGGARLVLTAASLAIDTDPGGIQLGGELRR